MKKVYQVSVPVVHRYNVFADTVEDARQIVATALENRQPIKAVGKRVVYNLPTWACEEVK